MKKYILTLAAVVCCAMTTTVFTACGDDDDPTPSKGYHYEVSHDILKCVDTKGVYKSIQNDFNKAIGYNGNMYNVSGNMKDNEMKNACDAVQKQYENADCFYNRFFLIRVTTDIQNGTTYKMNDTLATYQFGEATKQAYYIYAYTSTYNDVVKDLTKQKSTMDPAVYKATVNTINALTTGFKMRMDAIKNPVIENKAMDEAIKYSCDSIFEAHVRDTLAVKITYAVYKTEFVEGKWEYVWNKFLPVHVE